LFRATVEPRGDIMETSIAVFRGKDIRKTIHDNEWWFVIVDVVSALTDSINPGGYIKDMRRRYKELSKGWGKLPPPLQFRLKAGLSE
jgi:prophage antirepressor-like protein